jgi:hypothetical protein
MAKRRHTPEQIIGKLREAEVELARGQVLGEVVRKLGIRDAISHIYCTPKNCRLESA